MTPPATAQAYRWSQLTKDEPMPLLERRRVIGEKVMLSQVLLKKGCVVPMHRHENEQFACILSGRLRFRVERESVGQLVEMTLGPGEVLHLPSGVPHSAEAVEETLVLDVFSPPSERTGIDRG